MIGDKLKNLLALRGMRQSELARRTGISKQTINSIITRNNKNVDFSKMEKIADVLDVPIEYFFDRNPGETNETPTGDSGLREDEREFVDVFAALTPANRALFLEIAEVILRAQEAAAAAPDQPSDKD